jgi:hypothetical protein
MKDVKRGIAPDAGSMAARTTWAMREIFGKEGAEEMMDADMSKQEYKRRAKEGAVEYFQADMEKCLRESRNGEQFLMMKPEFGMSKWLECVATSKKLCMNRMAARFVQMRGGGISYDRRYGCMDQIQEGAVVGRVREVTRSQRYRRHQRTSSSDAATPRNTGSG